jgi:hypothetical protein
MRKKTGRPSKAQQLVPTEHSLVAGVCLRLDLIEHEAPSVIDADQSRSDARATAIFKRKCL